jgi:hypothetical protein
MTLVTWFIVEGRINPFKTREVLDAFFVNAGNPSDALGVSPDLNHFAVSVGEKTDVIVGAPGFKNQVVNTGTNQCGANHVQFQCPHIRVTLDLV